VRPPRTSVCIRIRGGAALAVALGWLAVAGGGRGGPEGEGFAPDRPATWEVRDPDLYGIDSSGDLVWAVGYWGTALRSTDGGATWSRASTPTRETLFDVSFADDRHGRAVGENGTLLVSSDGGATWSLETAILEEGLEARPLDLHLFGVAAVSPREAWAVGDLGLVLHLRDGARWEQVRIPEEAFADDETPERILNAVHFIDAEHGWIVGEFGTVLRTVDGGRTWRGDRSFSGAVPDLYLFDVSAMDEQRAAVTGLAGIVLVTADGGSTWQPRATGLATGLYAISWRNPVGAAVGDRGEILMTADLGQSWQKPQRPPLFNWLGGVAAPTPGRLFAVGEKGVVLRSDDGGAHWKLALGPRPAPLHEPAAPPRSGGSDPPAPPTGSP
jgi:photosystem II stability/assembly factor-like uncharacterized protein